MSLERFKEAQEQRWSGYETALSELHAGRKTSHWIWYIFPQLASLGRSSTAQFYGLEDLDEACDYLRDPLLGPRLVEATQVVAKHLAKGVPLPDLMGSTVDSLKLVSSLTLFEMAAQKLQATSGADPAQAKFIELCQEILPLAARDGFPRCQATLTRCGEPGRD